MESSGVQPAVRPVDCQAVLHCSSLCIPCTCELASFPVLIPEDYEEYRQNLAVAGGSARRRFQSLAGACLERYVRANAGIAMDEKSLTQCCEVVWDMVETQGWPAPLSVGQEREATDTELPDLAVWVDRATRSFVTAGVGEQALACLKTAAGQLFKACLYPEITVCRESYRQQTADGRCKRQNHATAKTRLSGSPCVDCPFTVRLSAEQHAALLRKNWAPANSISFDSDPMCFLPEDFRGLRRFLWLHARTR